MFLRPTGSWDLFEKLTLGAVFGCVLLKVAVDSGAPAEFRMFACLAAASLGLVTLMRRKSHRRYLDGPRFLLLLVALWFLPDVYSRVGGDGAEYFVQVRSLLFDFDVDYANDYEGLGRAPVMSVREAVTSRPPVGVALFWIPGILLAHGVILLLNALGAGVAADGFSVAYTSAATATSYVFGWIAVFLVESMVRRRTGRAGAFWVAIAVALGTPLVFYMTANPSMSHAISAFTGALFVWLWLRISTSGEPSTWFRFGLVAGLVVLVRVQDLALILLALGPLAATRSLKTAIRFALGLGVAALLQASFWFSQHGSDFIAVMAEHSMVGRQRPAFFEFLMSPWHGLVSWTPIYGLALLGIVVLCRREPRRGIPLAVAFVAAVYLNGSIGDWWASESFGQRRMLGLTAVFGLGLAETLAWLQRKPFVLISGLVGFLIVWNLQFAYIYNSELAGPRDEAIALDRVTNAQVDVLYRRLLRSATWVPQALWVRGYDSLKGIWLFHGSKSMNGRVDLGHELPGYYPLVGDGWFEPEEEAGHRFRSSRSRRSWISVPLHDVERFNVVAYSRLGYEEVPLRLRLDVNGEIVGESEVSATWRELHFDVPARYWRRGINQLTFVYSTTPRRSIPGFRGRNSAVQVDWIEFRRQ